MVKKTKAGAEAFTPVTLLHNLTNPITTTSNTAAILMEKKKDIKTVEDRNSMSELKEKKKSTEWEQDYT